MREKPSRHTVIGVQKDLLDWTHVRSRSPIFEIAHSDDLEKFRSVARPVFAYDPRSRSGSKLRKQFQRTFPQGRFVLIVSEPDVFLPIVLDDRLIGISSKDTFVKDIETIFESAVRDTVVVHRVGFRRLVELALCKATDGSLGLSRRQNEIANCLAHGLRDKEIAARLKISPSTVHTHVFRILRRWSVHKRTDVAKVILESRTS